MNHDIRPISEAPTAVDTLRDSYAPQSPKVNPDMKIREVTEEKEIGIGAERGHSPVSDGTGVPPTPTHVDHDDGIDWNPGFKNQFPWIGFAGFVTIILATLAAVTILSQSNGKQVARWPMKRFTTQPNVLLNIANQVQNLGLITLIAQGLAIAWWRKALKGSSLGQLHRNHSYSISFYSIVTSGKHFNLIALAALMTKFAVIDSTLFQKATKVYVNQQYNYDRALVTGWMDSVWQPNSGGIPGDNGNTKTIDQAWANVLTAYEGKIANSKVHDLLGNKSSFYNCPYQQECYGYVQGLGFSFNCSTNVTDIDYGLQRQSQRGNGSTSYPLWNINFSPSWATDSKPYASIIMNMLYVDSHSGNVTGSCPGTLTQRTCELRPAVVDYPVTVMVPSQMELAGGNIVTHVKFFNQTQKWNFSVPLDGINQIDELKFVRNTDLNEQFNTTSTVGAMNFIMNNLYGSTANLTYNSNWNIEAKGASAQTTFVAETDADNSNRCYYDIDQAGGDDPTVQMLRKINTLSFVAALYHSGAPTTVNTTRKAQGLASQQFETTVTGIVQEYQTSFIYMAGGVVATLFTVICVLPVYWGFWELGRKVTLGPLEITNAFGAPITKPDQTKHYHGDFDQVLEDVKERRVQYGQLADAAPGEFGIAEPTRVVEPNASHTWRVQRKRQTRKIGIGAAVGGVIGATIGIAGAKQ